MKYTFYVTIFFLLVNNLTLADQPTKNDVTTYPTTEAQCKPLADAGMQGLHTVKHFDDAKRISDIQKEKGSCAAYESYKQLIGIP